MCTHVYVCMSVCTYVYININICEHACVYTYTSVYNMCTHLYMRTYIVYIHICMYMYDYMYSGMDTYMYRDESSHRRGKLSFAGGGGIRDKW